MAVIVNHRKEDIVSATHHLDITYCEQPLLNGTGGALLAARTFLETQDCENLLITMGDVPFVRPETYASLLDVLHDHDLVVLGFMPGDKKQYGVLEIEGNQVCRIIEWKYLERLFTGKAGAAVCMQFRHLRGKDGNHVDIPFGACIKTARGTKRN